MFYFFQVCRGRQRDSQIYHSIGHRLTVHVEETEDYQRVEQSGQVAGGLQIQPSLPPSSTDNIRLSGFLLTYECQYNTQFYFDSIKTVRAWCRTN